MPPMLPKDAAVEFLTLVARGEVDLAYARHVGESFRHHNPWFPGDAASLREAMRGNAQQNPDKTLVVKQVLQDGARVAELRDLGQPVPEALVNGNGMF